MGCVNRVFCSLAVFAFASMNFRRVVCMHDVRGGGVCVSVAVRWLFQW